MTAKQPKRIGVYAGTFDPVHSGHVTFALQALQAAKLDKVYFLPERQPRSKQHVEHFGHRVAMLLRATQPHPQFEVLELVDVNFSVERTLPKLQRQFEGDQLVFLFGSDVLAGLQDWPKVDKLLSETELVIGLRHQDNRDKMHKLIEAWPIQPRVLTMFPSYAPEVSSGRVREALRLRKPTDGLLTSVERYSDRNWLYVSLV
ncbi:MAG: adenylyltransferase/cytidyltransferase family protein [Patescibacteria group bacterium]